MANKVKIPIHTVQLDVNDDLSVKDAIQKIISERGKIDILVNNAGYGLFGSRGYINRRSKFFLS